MNDDRDIESLLRRYQPVGPPPELRARVVDGAVERRRAWPWIAAAAAMLIATVSLHAASARLWSAWVEAGDDSREQAITELTNMLGGGDRAQRIAEQIVAHDEPVTAVAAVGTSGPAR